MTKHELDMGYVPEHLKAAPEATPDIDATLVERGSRYGEFVDNARVAQELKRAMVTGLNWLKLAADQREALEMIAAKISRIVSGDPEYADNWTDIAGYALLIEKRLTTKETV